MTDREAGEGREKKVRSVYEACIGGEKRERL